MPFFFDEIHIYKGPSNDTYFGAVITAIDGATIDGLTLRTRILDFTGKPLASQTTGSTEFSLHLEVRFDGTHAVEWGPFFMGMSASCIEVIAIEFTSALARQVVLQGDERLQAALAHTIGPICK